MKVNIRAQRHASSVNLQDLIPAQLVRDSNLNLSIKTSWTSQGRINRIGPISGPNYYDVASSTHSIHEREKLGDNSPLHFTSYFFTFRSDCIQLVDKNDAGRSLQGFLENFSQPRL